MSRSLLAVLMILLASSACAGSRSGGGFHGAGFHRGGFPGRTSPLSTATAVAPAFSSAATVTVVVGIAAWVSERGRHAVAIAVEMDEACRRDALGILEEAIEWPAGRRHETSNFKAASAANGLISATSLGPSPLRRLSRDPSSFIGRWPVLER
jgi:hypothetical protein